MMQSDVFLKMLGLARRAGDVAFGEGAVLDSIRSRKAKLVIVARDASSNTKKKFLNKSEFYGVAYTEQLDRFTLGKACGKDFAVVMAVKNDGIAAKMLEVL